MKKPIARKLWTCAIAILLLSPGRILSAESMALEEVKVGYTSPSISAFPIEFARRKGFFREEGLNIVMIVMRTNIIMNALLTRGIDFGTPTTSLIRGAASDLPVKTVAVLTGRPDYFLVARKDIKSLRDLRGRRIGIGTFGAAADLVLRAVLRQEGLDADRDVIRLQMGGGDSRFAALAAGSVDATVLNFPFNLQAEKMGFNNLLWLGERVEMPLSGLGVRDDTLQKNPERVLGMLRAIYRAVVLAKAYPEDTVQAFMDWTRVDRELAAKSFELGKKSWPDNLVISDAAIRAVVEQAQTELKIKGTVSLDKVRDWSFTAKARGAK
ncbi:MAG TPA: ABC transporter substrate-binding protein [Methylomirabilota bacterium]|nr:ABC transporter substrate-binding protein [Methylomirabilota bacterium]